MLEASGFDFRTRHPQKTLLKLARQYGLPTGSEVSNLAYRISLDLYRTFAPLKQTASTMAFSCLELAGRLLGQRLEAAESVGDYAQWNTSREEIMGMSPIISYSSCIFPTAHADQMPQRPSLISLNSTLITGPQLPLGLSFQRTGF